MWQGILVSAFLYDIKIAGEILKSRASRSRSCHDGKAHGDVSLKSLLGVCEETISDTHRLSKRKSIYLLFSIYLIESICPTSFFFSLNNNEQPEAYPFSSINPLSQRGKLFSFL